MSEDIATSYCSNCKCHRPTSFFINPNRANPFKTCSNCRSKRKTHSKNSFHRKRTHSETLLPSVSRILRPIDLPPDPTIQVVGRNSHLDQFNQVNHRENDRQILPEIEELPVELISNETTNEVPSAPYDNPNLDEHFETVIQGGHTDIPIDPLLMAIPQEASNIVTDEVEINERNVTVMNAPRRLPPWRKPLPVRRSVPAGYWSKYNPNMVAHNLGNRTSICPFCDAIHWAAERVQSSSVANPRFQTCCKEGQVKVDAIPEPPELLKRLWTSEEAEAKEFRRNCHSYNRAFAFTSFNYTADRRLEERGIHGGIQSFSIHGQIYHQTGGALREGAVPSYAQVYFLDGNEAVDTRSTRYNLNPIIVRELTAMIETTNPFVHFYRTAHESLNDSNLEGEHRVVITPQFRLVREEGTDRRRYNLPTTSEFAIVIPDEVDSDNRDVILYQRNGDGTLSSKFQYIHRGHPAYLPLHYVLFYPFGNPGYHWAIKLASSNQRVLGNIDSRVLGNQPEDEGVGRRSKCVSARLYYRYHLFSRIDRDTMNIKFNTLVQGRRLFQQLCCDMYACVDDSILNWHRINQDTVRADLQSCLIDALRSEFEVQSIGKPVILSSSYIGGDRHMTQCYQDAMAIVRAVGKPSFFITFTANPSWPEILSNLEYGQTPDSRPDLIAITFKMKLDALLHDVKVKNIFGVCIADLYTIEYQKRGLPHAHILLFLHHDQVPHTAAEIDELVSAQLPIDDPILASIIKSQLTHGPCGPGYPNAPCMRDGKCSKGFPKRYCDHTVISEDSYPEYARPNNGKTWSNGRFEFDNRWVVPYNAYLTKKYNAHINVEVARGVQAIKYLAKYVYKGCDRASLSVDGQYDEIAMTLQGRYICPIQAVWRLMGYATHEEKPPVMLLPFHQEGMHRVAFNEKLSKEQVALAAHTQSSPFIDWMKYNAENEDGLDLLYGEFPSFYTHHKSRGWKKRKNGFSIGRMPLAVPRQGEHFYLRTLLTVKCGAKSFRDLYTVDGIEYEDPSAACRALGLVFDDSDWVSLLEDVKDSESASSLRQTFASAIHYSAIICPQELWNRFKINFTDDCLWRIRTLGESLSAPPTDWTEEKCRFDYGLWLLGDNLRHVGLDWKSARLDGPEHRWIVRETNALLADALDFDRESETTMHASSINLLSAGQRAAYDTIVNSIESGLGESIFFLQGAAGTGKTFVYKTLCGLYRSQSKIVLCVASSGIAALLLPNGRTAHSLFKIPLNCPENAVCNIRAQDHLAELLRQTSLIIWDEVTMQQKNDFAAVDRTLRDIKKKLNVMFGGIPVLMGGDFAQILPVVTGGNREKVVTACIRSWSLWTNIKPLFLTENMRVISGNANQRFAEWLSRLSYDSSQYGPIEIPEWINTTSDRNIFREFVYPKRELELGDTAIFEDRMVLTGLNDSVDKFNKEIAEIRATESREYIACDHVPIDESGQTSDCPVEVLRILQVKGLPDGKLKLQVGMPVMLLRNYYPKEGLCNGTRLIITRLYNFCIKGRIISRDPRFNGKEHLISRVTLSSDEGLDFTLTRKQLPLQPCFSMTINKSQGQTLNYVGVDLTNPVFTHGQFYVAMSRITDVNRLIILLPPGAKTTQNIVYPEVLLRPSVPA